MTPSELTELHLNQRVAWNEDGTRYLGTVIEVGYAGVKIEYDDGTVATVMQNDPPDRLEHLEIAGA